MKITARTTFLLASACFAAGASMASRASAQLPPGSWQLLFADEFNGANLDTVKWSTAYPWGRTHNYPAYIDDANITVGGGTLNLQAKRQSEGGQPYTSGAINSNGKFSFHTGYVEARMQLPNWLGAWPAFWALQNGWPPELDVMEARFRTDFDAATNTYLGYADMYSYTGNYHWGADYTQERSAGTGFKYPGGNLTAAFHNYGTLWAADHLTFYFDGQQQGTVWSSTADIAQMQKMYLLLNLGVGGWPGNPPDWADLSAPFKADWVRVWQAPAATLRSSWTKVGNGNQNWDDGTSWNNGAPSVGSEEAFFGNVGGGTTDVRLDWVANKTVGAITFQSSINYTIGWPNDSLMMANTSGRAYINGYNQSGQGHMAIGSRLELYNDTTVQNWLDNPISLNGDIIGGGELSIEQGKTTLNGVATHTGGTQVTKGGDLTVSGTINTPDDAVNLARDAGTTGTLRLVAGGTITANIFRAGDTNGGTGILYQTGGTFNAGEWFIVGQSGSADGTVNQSAGTLNVRTAAADGDLEVAVFGKTTGAFNLSGGAVKLLRGASLVLGSRTTSGNGTFNQTGGSVTFYSDAGTTVGGAGAGTLMLGRTGGTATGTYTYSLSGGTLLVPSIVHGGSGSGIFNFNGGTLLPTGNTTAFVAGLTAAHVQAGGAIVDSNNYNVTIAQPLLHDAALGTSVDGGLTKKGAGTLTLTGAATFTGAAKVLAGTLAIGPGGSLPAASTVLNNAAFAVNATTPTNFISGTGNTTVASGATLTSNYVRQASLTANGAVNLRPASAGGNTSVLGSLALGAAGTIDLSDNALIVDYAATGVSPIATIAGAVKSAYNTGGIAWKGVGLTSSAAATRAGGAVGYGEAAALLSLTGTQTATFMGQPVDATSVLVRYTRAGDANLDGQVNFADFVSLSNHFGTAVSSGWSAGDFNYDGVVDFADFVLLSNNFGNTPTAAQAQAISAWEANAAAIASVPEPANVALLGLGAIGLLARRRRVV